MSSCRLGRRSGSWIKVLENTVSGGAKRWNAVSASTVTAASEAWNLEMQAGACCSQSDWGAICSAQIVRIMERKASKKIDTKKKDTQKARPYSPICTASRVLPQQRKMAATSTRCIAKLRSATPGLPQTLNPKTTTAVNKIMSCNRRAVTLRRSRFLLQLSPMETNPDKKYPACPLHQ